MRTSSISPTPQRCSTSTKKIGRAVSAPDSSRQERWSRVPRWAPMLEQPFHACFMTTPCTHTIYACQCSFKWSPIGRSCEFTPELQQLMKFVRHSLRHETFNYLSTAWLVHRHDAIAYLAQPCDRTARVILRFHQHKS